MIEAFVKKFNSLAPASYVTGSELIDSVWVTNNLAPKEVLVLLANFEVGACKVILVDLDFNEVIERGVQTCNPSIRRLICENSQLV